jgi:hypothetical protein
MGILSDSLTDIMVKAEDFDLLANTIKARILSVSSYHLHTTLTF